MFPEHRYAIVELELLAMVWACKKSDVYIRGMMNVQLVTDHKPLTPIVNMHRLDEIDNPRLLRLKLLPYDAKAVWMKGADNRAADALFRHPLGQPKPEEEWAELLEEADGESRTVYVRSVSKALAGPEYVPIREETEKDALMRALVEAIMLGFPDERGRMKEELKPFWGERGSLRV